MKMLDGFKNYLFGGAMILAGATNFFFPEMNIRIFGMEETSTLITTGIGWMLGRNALKKIEA